MDNRFDRIFNECIEKLRKIDIPIGNIKSVVLTHNNTYWGQCISFYDGYRIEIDSLLNKKKYENGLRTVIIHELLHTCPKCAGHNNEWKRFAKKVKTVYGYDINISDEYYQLGISTKDYIKYQQPKYVLECMDCGTVIAKSRACHMTRNYIFYRCSKCGGVLLMMPEDKLKKMKG